MKKIFYFIVILFSICSCGDDYIGDIGGHDFTPGVIWISDQSMSVNVEGGELFISVRNCRVPAVDTFRVKEFSGEDSLLYSYDIEFDNYPGEIIPALEEGDSLKYNWITIKRIGKVITDGIGNYVTDWNYRVNVLPNPSEKSRAIVLSLSVREDEFEKLGKTVMRIRQEGRK